MTDSPPTPSNDPGEQPADPVPPDPTGEGVDQKDLDALIDAAKGVDPPAGVGGNEPPQAEQVADTSAEVASAVEASSAGSGTGGAAASVDLPNLDTEQALRGDVSRITMLNDVNLRVKIQLGKTQMLVEDVLALGEGSVVELDKLAGDPVDVFVNERLIARGEVLVLNDNFCVRICEVLSNDPHRVMT